MPRTPLTEQFERDGLARLAGAFPTGAARAMADVVWAELARVHGTRRDDRSTWPVGSPRRRAAPRRSRQGRTGILPGAQVARLPRPVDAGGGGPVAIAGSHRLVAAWASSASPEDPGPSPRVRDAVFAASPWFTRLRRGGHDPGRDGASVTAPSWATCRCGSSSWPGRHETRC